jgi:beta-glucosidase
VLEAWYPGQEGGHAIADLLFGDANPSGKLTISVPRHVGQLPVHVLGKRSRGKRYLEMDSKPLYPFGFGLSYTTFAYGGLTLDAEEIRADGETTARVTVTNAGPVAGAEVVQLYVSDVVSSVTRPAMELRGFRKIYLEPGESREIAFRIGKEQLQYANASGERYVEPGRFEIKIGTSSVDTIGATLTVREAT